MSDTQKARATPQWLIRVVRSGGYDSITESIMRIASFNHVRTLAWAIIDERETRERLAVTEIRKGLYEAIEELCDAVERHDFATMESMSSKIHGIYRGGDYEKGIR